MWLISNYLKKPKLLYKEKPFDLYICIRKHNSHLGTSTESRMAPTILQYVCFLRLTIAKSKQL